MAPNSTVSPGVLLIDKPAGPTSHDVVAHIRRLIKAGLPTGPASLAKVGHAGTLDPFATGLLIIAIGQATRLLEYTLTLPKTYQVALRLGAQSTTDDLTGTLTPISSQAPSHKQLEDALEEISQRKSQVPPWYSAIKIKGQKLYEIARQAAASNSPAGVGDDPRPARPVTIYSLHVRAYAYPELSFEVTVSRGTYIRALVRDLGELLKTGAYASQLRRTSLGTFLVKNAVKFEQLAADSLAAQLIPSRTLIAHLPQHQLTQASVAKFKQGQAVMGENLSFPNHQSIIMTDPEAKLIGVARFSPATHLLSPQKVFHSPLE